MKTLLFVLTLLLSLNLSATPDRDAVVHFKGRNIDLQAYYGGFPYSSFFVHIKQKKVFFKKTEGDSQFLYSLPFKGDAKKLDFTKAVKLSSVDFSKRNFWGALYSGLTEKTYVLSDENNEEIFNIYEVTAKGDLKKMTHVSDIYDWQLTHDQKAIVYTARLGQAEGMPGEVRSLDLMTGKESTLYKDTPKTRLFWGTPSIQPNDQGVIIPFCYDGDRNKINLMYVSLRSPGKSQVVTDLAVAHEDSPVDTWVDNNTFLFTSNEKGPVTVYKQDLAGGRAIAVTDPAANISSASAIISDDKPIVVAVARGPINSRLTFIDPSTLATIQSTDISGDVTTADTYKDQVALSYNSINNPLTISLLKLSSGKVAAHDKITYPDDLLKKIIHCIPEKKSYETFDKLSAPGEKGTLHAFLMRPKNPLPDSEKLLLVEAFYGGVNAYQPQYQMMCEAGFYIMSPAPRGSWEWGKDFQNLIIGDLGGNEVLDVIASAKFGNALLGISPKHTGAFGGSHGGYEAMRQLTFPGSINGYKEPYKWGFGISDYGISNLIRFFKTSNIPGWATQLIGEDPTLHPGKWLDRSPETHVASLHGPIFIAHGSNDHRVPVEESRSIVAALKALKSPVTYLEIPGQGHGFKGMPAVIEYYKARFQFLETIK